MPMLKFKDLEMYYEKMGSGDNVIFLHSSYSRGILAFSNQMLDFQNKYTCYFPDFRGHGRTRCESLEWSTPRITEDIIDFMDQLDIAAAHLIGYSMGANVGLYLATNHPERVVTLTTIGTSGFCDPTGAEEFEPEWLIQHGLQDTIDQMIERHLEAHRGHWEAFMRQSAQDWRLYPQLTLEQLGNIQCPALFITGEHDHFVGEEKVKRLASLVKESRYHVVQNGSHRPHMVRENPIEVNDTILQFLEHNKAPGY
ncbi:alpha/beta hydrolase [Paenibacillus sp. CAA11]|uniref:alpha/beta fold hydrolase n=1 Tax=Paenibacillus sp. CAA11 TaxID=1532905 RepID=UPI000D347351|nr:alpha/beta hydrolase [Paenibacillus sp. CAA11]AWB44685.1 alpha/beta hydrolase [Paenibacillus sp. CAA11]